MEDKIFEYKLYNALGMPYTEICIYDRESDNVECQDYLFCHVLDPDELFNDKKPVLDIEAIKQIKDMITENKKLFDIEEVESTPVLDGSESEFFFRHEDRSVRLKASNIWYFMDEDEDMDGTEPVNAKLVLKVFERICEILKENGIDERYLAFDMPDQA